MSILSLARSHIYVCGWKLHGEVHERVYLSSVPMFKGATTEVKLGLDIDIPAAMNTLVIIYSFIHCV